MCAFVCVRLCLYVYVSVYMSVCVYVYVHVCACVYVCVHDQSIRENIYLFERWVFRSSTLILLLWVVADHVVVQ